MPTFEETQHVCPGEENREGLLLALSRGMLVIRRVHRAFRFRSCGGGRGSIAKFSASAASRMSRYLRNCVAEYRTLITLTYPYAFPIDGRESKDHLRRFIQELRRHDRRARLDDSGFSVFWFMEFQRRGAIHYHLFTTRDYPKEWIASLWYRIVDSEDARHLAAGTRIERIKSGRGGTCAYARKYAVKQEQKDIPSQIENAGRFWGVSGNRSTVVAAIAIKPSAFNELQVQNKLKEVKQTINEGIKSGSVRKWKSDRCFGSKVFLINASCQKKVREWFLRMEVWAHLVDGVIYRTEERHQPDEFELFE